MMTSPVADATAPPPPGDAAAATPDSPNAADNVAPAQRSRFAVLHSQTYEMELLISGALVFGLLQLPDRLNGWFDRVNLLLDGELRLMATYGYVYVLMAVWALALFLLVHVCLRAYWIGLLGLESVFPAGIDWDRSRLGPRHLAYWRPRLPALAKSIERLDDVCSLLFSFASLIVLSFVYSVLLVGSVGFLSFTAGKLLGVATDVVFWSAFGLILGAVIVVGMADRKLGDRLPTDGRADRLLRGAVSCLGPLSPLHLVGRIQLVLQSRMTEVRANVLVMGSFTVLSFLVVGWLLVQAGVLSASSLIYLPEDGGSQAVEPLRYRSMWQNASARGAFRGPSIDADVITGPYVRLVIPYRPDRHNERIARACPQVAPLRDEGLAFDRGADQVSAEQARSGLDCLVGLYEIRLDGKVMEGLDVVWWREPTYDIPAAMAYIDARDLTPGRHLLEVRGPWRRFDPSTTPDPVVTIAIPFWR